MSPRASKTLKIWLGILLVLALLTTGFFTFCYFYYGRLIKSYLIETVEKQSKGLYKAGIGSIYLNVLAGDLVVRDLELTPDTAFYRKRIALADTLSPMLFRLKLERITVENFGIMDAFRKKMIHVKAIRFRSPEISVFRMRLSEKAKEDKPSHKLMAIPLPPGWKSIAVGSIELLNGRLDFYDLTGDSVVHQDIPVCNITIRGILVDSLHRGDRRLFNADDISIQLDSLKFKTKNGLNEIRIGQAGISTGRSEVWIRDFHLIPQYNHHDYTRKLGFQTDRMDIFTGKISLQRVNLRALALTGRLSAGLLEVDSLVLDDYRDKRIPRKPGVKPPMPQQAVRNLKMYLKIDTVLLHNGKATYSEQTGKEPGTIFFDKMEARLTGLTNDSALLAAGLISELEGTAWMMGKGKLDLKLGLKFGDLKNSFTFSAELGPVDLREINPMVTKLLPAEVISGNVKKLVVPGAVANDDVAKGKLMFYYTDLKISMTSEKKTTWNSIKKGVVNFVANDLVVNNDNPTKSGKMKTGIIYFERDKSKSIINFLWKSALSGLKSTMGFNSKAQKELREAEEDAKSKK